MPLCPECGTDNHASLEECIYCGHPLHNKKPSVLNTRSTEKKQQPSNPPIDLGFLILIGLALFFPFVGFIVFFSVFKRQDNRAKYILFAAILNIIWSMIVSVNTV